MYTEENSGVNNRIDNFHRFQRSPGKYQDTYYLKHNNSNYQNLNLNTKYDIKDLKSPNNKDEEVDFINEEKEEEEEYVFDDKQRRDKGMVKRNLKGRGEGKRERESRENREEKGYGINYYDIEEKAPQTAKHRPLVVDSISELEKELSALLREKNKLEGEIMKMPERLKNMGDIRHRERLNGQVKELDYNINEIRKKLRKVNGY